MILRKFRTPVNSRFTRLCLGTLAAAFIPVLICAAFPVSGATSSKRVAAQSDGQGLQPSNQKVEQSDSCIPDEQREQVNARVAAFERSYAGREDSPLVFPNADEPQRYPFFPQAGKLWQDLFINNFADLDPTSGIRDWDCTNFTYNGHRGHDSDLRSFQEQLIGVPIFAALDGVVVDVHDGEVDMNTSASGQPANYVILSHGNTHYTWYYHMKRNSVAVTLGQSVTAGTQLGLTASSGSSTGPHLHFESHYGNTWYEPSAGACRTGSSFWVNQTPIRRDMFIRDFTFSTANFNGNNGLPFDQAPRVGTYISGSHPVYFRIELANLPASSTYRIRFLRPDGTTAFNGTGAFNNASAFRQSWWWWNYTLNWNMVGTWRLLLDVNNQTAINAPFKIVSSSSEIVNRPPNPVTISVDAAEPVESQPIFCRVQTSNEFEDPDYDIVRYQYRWLVNGALVRSVETAALSDAIPKGSFVRGDLITCGVTPTDGRGGTADPVSVTLNTSPPSVLEPLADTWVQGAEAFRNTNYGASIEMQVKRTFNAGAGRGRRAFLKFDTSSVTGAITRARLRIFARLSDASLANVPMRVQKVDDTSWEESGVTWNAQPAVASPDALAPDAIVASSAGAYYEYDLTAFIQAERAAGRFVVSFRLINMQPTGTSGAFYTVTNSREAENGNPQLVIEQ